MSRDLGKPRENLIILNRVPGMAPIHYGDPFGPLCRIAGTNRPWLTSWFVKDTTCKRCLTIAGTKSA